MKREFWVLLAIGAVAFGVMAIALGLAHNTDAILAPARVILFLLGVALYLLPSGLAVHRDCRATAWIIMLNVLLGWTVVGWIAAIGWAAWGKARTTPTFPAPPGAVVTGH